MSIGFWGILAAGWAAAIALGLVVRRLAPEPDDPRTGLAMLGLKMYARLVHGLRIEGALSMHGHSGPLVLVANHTAGVDPLLIQSACPFFVRWMMAEDMRWPALSRLWEFGRIIFVDRHAGGAVGLREAMGALRQGDVVGIFPEGGIEVPPQTILPFREGVGVLIRRSKAIVLPVVIDGTPQVSTARTSLWTPSRARLRFMPPINYTDAKLSAAEITADLHSRFLEWTQWPESTQPPLPG